MRIHLAPMEGVVDFLTRDILTEIGGIDLCVTEFIRVTDRIVPKHVFYKMCPELKTGGKTRSGVPVMVQLLGGQPQPLAENAAIAIEMGAPGIDLNFGCPAKKVNQHDGGAVLLRSPERLEAIVSTVRRAVPATSPVTAKVRLGCEDKSLFLENAQAAESGGASWLTVHARTKIEGYRPPAHWHYIAEIKNQLSIPVVANGDIFTPQDLTTCREVTGCDQFMVGRGAIQNPGLCQSFRSGKNWSFEQAMLTVLQFLELASKRSIESYAVNRTKQWLKQVTTSFGQKEVFDAVKRLQCAKQMHSILSQDIRSAV